MQYLRIFFVLLSLSFVFSSCQKEEFDKKESENHKEIQTINNAERSFRNDIERDFFSMLPKQGEIKTRSRVPQLVIGANNTFYDLNLTEEFISDIILKLGTPDWNGYVEISEGLIYIPTIKDNDISGLLAFLIIEDKITFHSYRKNLLLRTNVYQTSNSEIAYDIISNYQSFIQDPEDFSTQVRGCVQPCCWETVHVTDAAGQTGTYQVCQCASGPTLNSSCCGDCSGLGELDGGAAEAGGWTIEEWMAIIDQWWDENTGEIINNNNASGSGGGDGNNKSNRVKLIRDLVDEQFIVDWFLEYLNIQIGEDGTNMDIVALISGNPQITNPIYLYLNGYYTGVTVNSQYAIDLINLLVDHDLNLSNLEIEHILTFEPELIEDIQTFLDAHPNDPLAIQIIHDFIDLQYCDTENPCIHTDYENQFENFYNYLIDNPNHDFNYILNNKTDLTSESSETWDSVDGPFADHPIEPFNSDQNPWPSYGPVIDKSDATVLKFIDYDCHVYAKKQLAEVGYTISNYFLVYNSAWDNDIHYETIQPYTEYDGININEVQQGLDYLYSALKRNIPVMVGVSYQSGSENPLTDNTTEHFIVIVGMGTDSNGNYFSFYDSGSSNVDLVTHADNKLYFNNNMFQGTTEASFANGFTYTLAQIRKSKPN